MSIFGSPRATVQIAPRKFCLEEVYVLKAQ